MQTNLVSWNPSSRAQFASYSQNKLHLLEFSDENKSGDRTLQEIKAWEAPQVSCLDWRPPSHGSVLAYGTRAGTVHLVNAESGDEVSVAQGTKLGRRTCNAVCWNKLMPSQLLAGFDSMKSEFCAIVWDFEHEHYLQTSFSEAACSVSWLPDNAHSLAVGTSMGWVKVYDTRTNTSGASCSIMAHPAPRPRKIRGIRPDPFRPHLFATYSDYPGDVVKVWDLRKVANPSSKAAVVPPSFIVYPQTAGTANASPINNSNTHSTSYFVNGGGTEAEAVADVAWSTSRPGVLAVATSSRPVISFFSTNTASGSSQVPLYSVAVPEPVQVNGLSWQQGDLMLADLGNNSTSSLVSNSSPSSPLVADRKSIVSSMTVPMSSPSLSSSAAASTSHNALPSWEAFRAEEELRTCAHASILKVEGSAQHASSHHHHHHGNSVVAQPQPRLLAATVSSEVVNNGAAERRKDGFAEVEVLDRIPLAISTAGGLLAVNTAKGRQVALTTRSINKLHCRQFTSPRHDPGTGEDLPLESVCDLYKSTDVCDIMRRRCLAGYSADAYANVDVLAEELDAVYGAAVASKGPVSPVPVQGGGGDLLSMAIANTKAVYRTWVWMDRFETTINESGLTVSNCGVLEVLLRSQIQQSTGNLSRQQNRISRHPILCANVYSSERRDLSKKMCGWIKMFGLGKSTGGSAGTESISATSTSSKGKASGVTKSGSMDAELERDTSADDDLLEVIVDEFFLDSFERAAAIALWHGRLDLAVSVLRRAIAEMERSAGVVSGLAPNSTDPLTEDQAADKIIWDAPYGSGYLQTISLVAMCFAGYNFPQNASESKTESPGKNRASMKPSNHASPAATWASMCRHVLVQLQLSAREATGYLAAACHFLLANLREDEVESKESTQLYSSILSDQRLTMEDRVAFACTYLSDEEVTDWLVATTERCAEKGSIEGLIITGLSATGLSILQKYVDIYDDVQTVALLVSRVIDSQQAHTGDSSAASSSSGGAGSDVVTGPTREWMWLHEYRNLLNKWEMFIERAYLDVELGKRYRRKAAMLAAGPGGASASAGRGGSNTQPNNMKKSMAKGQQQQQQVQQSKGKSSGKAGRVLYRLPVHSDYPHFYLRCGFCGVTLPVDGMQNIRPEHLRLQNNVLNCCSACSKQLPRCYVCQLYMGMVNPYLELNRVMTQKRLSADKLLATSDRGGAGQQSVDDSSSVGSSGTGTGSALQPHQKELDHNTVFFGKWFFFCQHCRHGGHANCIDQWFGGDAPAQQGTHSN
eukprot:gene14614-16769_t